MDWSDIVYNKELNISFDLFHKELPHIIDDEAPFTSYIPNSKINDPWLLPSVRKCMKTQLKLYKETLKNSASDSTHQKYKNYRNCLTKLKRNCRIMFYQNQCEQLK